MKQVLVPFLPAVLVGSIECMLKPCVEEVWTVADQL
jgi:hypothetical protein